MRPNFRSWLECVDLHADVLANDFSEDLFALDLGPLSDYLIANDLGQPQADQKRVPAVYRDAESFFAASYLTSGLKSLLGDVLSGLAGKGANRVLRLQTPFGGGKSHTLAALLHAARSRASLDALPEITELAQPKDVRVAVVDGQFFDAMKGKRIPDGDIAAKTLWGWIAWALGGREGYDLLRAQDKARVAPGGDMLVELLKGGPSLILLDELLQYLISAGGIRIEQTTLRDETLSFLQRLTVAAGSVDNAVLVFALQSSKRESLEYTSLLQTIEHLSARKDQRREPVEGNEILNVVQRRLLAGRSKTTVAVAAADAFSQVFTQMRRAYAHGDEERRQAEEDGLALRERITASYPFHPALIDLMRERWAAIPDFQRTRGALRFLASCLRAAHRAGSSRTLLGPGDVHIHDNHVRLAFFKEVGQREDFLACLEHDFIGANSRTRRIDDRRSREVTTESGKQPATRLATTILLYSFGGLRRGGRSEQLLPPGIGEPELLAANVGPDLDNTTIQACIKELREQCLYLHFDGVHYCFKKDPNITLLIEQEAETVGHDRDHIMARSRQLIEDRLAGQHAIVWPAKPSDVPDHEPQFILAYLPLDFTTKPISLQRRTALDFCEQCGNRQREFRNGLGLAVPSADQVNSLLRGVRYIIAIERIQRKWREHNLTEAQRAQLRERLSTEKAATESAVLKLYAEVWLPASVDGELDLETFSIGDRPLQMTLDDKKHALIQQRLTELLTTVQRKIFGTLAASKITELFELGEPGAYVSGIATAEVLKGFYEFIGFPRLLSADAVRLAVARGVETGLFAYATGRPQLGEDGRYLIDRSRITFERSVADEEIDLDTGWLITPAAIPENAPPSGSETTTTTGTECGAHTEQSVPVGSSSDGRYTPRGGSSVEIPSSSREINLSFEADQSKVYEAWSALANLADMAGAISIKVAATAPMGYDEAKLENGVLEPLRELGLIEND